MSVSCDFLIVGGGVIGTSIAFHLAQRGVGRVALLEKSYLGAGSSGKSGAIVRQHYSNRLTASGGVQRGSLPKSVRRLDFGLTTRRISFAVAAPASSGNDNRPSRGEH
jgi:glycine/D-amino acid oxidase-like deaminating enzyme